MSRILPLGDVNIVPSIRAKKNSKQLFSFYKFYWDFASFMDHQLFSPEDIILFHRSLHF